MKVGLPGVGIGGVFYILLVAWMPIRELWLTFRGRSNAQRWRRVALQMGLAGAIVAGLGAEWWAMTALPEAAWQMLGLGGELLGPVEAEAAVAAGPFGLADETVSLEYLAPAIVATPFVIIAAIMVGLRLLRLAVRPARNQEG